MADPNGRQEGEDTWTVPGLNIEEEINVIDPFTYEGNPCNPEGEDQAIGGACRIESNVSLMKCTEYHWIAHLPRTIEVRPAGKNERICSLPPGGSVAFNGEHIRDGLSVPLPPFLLQLLQFYKLALAQLSPNSIRLVLAYMARCKLLGISPHVDAFRYYFMPCNESQLFAGYVLLKSRVGIPKILGCLRSSGSEWRSRFFFIRSAPGEAPLDIPYYWRTIRPRVKDSPPFARNKRHINSINVPGPRDVSILTSPELLAFLGVIKRPLTPGKWDNRCVSTCTFGFVAK